MTRRSGFNALTLVSVADMSDRSRGSLSSMTIFMPYFEVSSITPARTSSENGSFSKAKATFTSCGCLPFFLAISAANVIALARYCSDVDSTAKMYLLPCVNSERDAPSASTIGILYFAVTGAIALVRPEL